MAVVTGSPRNCSGAAYAGVSTRCAVRVTDSGASEIVQPFGDAEVEQLDVSEPVDEDVGGLEVAVDDQLRVGVLDGQTHLPKQCEPSLDRELVDVAVSIRCQAVDVLQHEERRAFVHARVQEAGDVWMPQPGERFSFALEPTPSHRRYRHLVQDFEGHEWVRVVVTAPSQVERDPFHHGRAVHHPKWTDRGGRLVLIVDLGEKTGRLGGQSFRIVGSLEQNLHQAAQLGVVAAGCQRPGGPLGPRKVEHESRGYVRPRATARRVRRSWGAFQVPPIRHHE